MGTNVGKIKTAGQLYGLLDNAESVKVGFFSGKKVQFATEGKNTKSASLDAISKYALTMFKGEKNKESVVGEYKKVYAKLEDLNRQAEEQKAKKLWGKVANFVRTGWIKVFGKSKTTLDKLNEQMSSIEAAVALKEEAVAQEEAKEEAVTDEGYAGLAAMFDRAEEHAEANYEAIRNASNARATPATDKRYGRSGGCVVDLHPRHAKDSKKRLDAIRTRKGTAGYSLDELEAVEYQYIKFLNERMDRATGKAHSGHIAVVQGRKATIDAKAYAKCVALAYKLGMRQAGADVRRATGLEAKRAAAKKASKMKAGFLKSQALKKEIVQLQAELKGLTAEDRVRRLEIGQRMSAIELELEKIASEKGLTFLRLEMVDREANRALHAADRDGFRLASGTEVPDAYESSAGPFTPSMTLAPEGGHLRFVRKDTIGKGPATGPGILGTGVDFESYAIGRKRDAREAQAGSSRSPTYLKYTKQKWRKGRVARDIAAQGDSIQTGLKAVPARVEAERPAVASSTASDGHSDFVPGVVTRFGRVRTRKPGPSRGLAELVDLDPAPTSPKAKAEGKDKAASDGRSDSAPGMMEFVGGAVMSALRVCGFFRV